MLIFHVVGQNWSSEKAVMSFRLEDAGAKWCNSFVMFDIVSNYDQVTENTVISEVFWISLQYNWFG